MLSKEQNDLITLTDAGTPGGELMRRYWQPVALSEELTADTPLPTRLLGEDLVLFRDPSGRPQLIGRYCPHRGVDLSYGRLDKGGAQMPLPRLAHVGRRTLPRTTGRARFEHLQGQDSASRLSRVTKQVV